MDKEAGTKLSRLDTKSMSPPAQKLYEMLSAKVKGQERAVKEIVSAFELQISGIDLGNRPKFVGMFLGPSGVGKTLVAEMLAEAFFGDRTAFTKIEGASYSQEHQVALLIGSPPGYIGFNQDANANTPYPLLSQFNIEKPAYIASQYTPEAKARNENLKKINTRLQQLAAIIKKLKAAKEDDSEEYKKSRDEFTRLRTIKEKLEEEKNAVKEKQIGDGPQYDSIVLFDEIEKAHPHLWNILLEISDKGRLTLSNGKVTDFRRSYIIMTTNTGSSEIRDILSETQLGFKAKLPNNSKARNAKDQEIYTMAMQRAADTFPPEFLGRIDAMVVFRPLDRDVMREIFDVQKTELVNALNASGLFMQLNIDEEAVNFIINQATKRSDYGARLLKHRIDEYLKKPLARLKNWGKEKGIVKGDIVYVKYEMVDGRKKLVFYRAERVGTLNGQTNGAGAKNGNGKPAVPLVDLESVDLDDIEELKEGDNE